MVSHLRVDLRGDADAVIAGDGELVVQDPAGGPRARLEGQVGGERMEVGHMAVSEEEVVSRTVNVVSHLGAEDSSVFITQSGRGELCHPLPPILTFRKKPEISARLMLVQLS